MREHPRPYDTGPRSQDRRTEAQDACPQGTARHMRAPTMRAAAAAAALALLLAGCGGAAQDTTQSSTQAATAAASPSFTRPWASEFTNAYSKAQTDFGRSILADGDISAQEMEEVETKYYSCIEDQGYIVKRTSEGADVSRADGTLDQAAYESTAASCDAESDESVIGSLYANYHGNPNREDPAKILLSCLKRHGLADQSMSVDEFKQTLTDSDKRDAAFGKYLDNTRSDYDSAKAAEYQACNADPSQ